MGLSRWIRFIVSGIERGRPRHTGGDFRADAQSAHAKCANHGAAGFAAGNNQAPNTSRNQGLGDSRQHPLDRLLDAFRRSSAVNSAVNSARLPPGSQLPGSADLLSGCGRINEDRGIAELRTCPLSHRQHECIGGTESLLGIDAPSGKVRSHPLDLRLGGDRTTSRNHQGGPPD
jgi:hypothetical protein